jgi:6-phosphogluconolactonase
MPIVAASLVVASSKNAVPYHLNAAIVDICSASIKARGAFTIALSGGSLPSFLSTIKDAFDAKGLDPKFESWHVLLADERCVPSTDPDSNLGALQESFLSKVPIPSANVYGISEERLQESTQAVAVDYEARLRQVLSNTGGHLDLAVLGFGPDGRKS